MAVLRQNSRPTVSAKVAPWLYRVAVRQVINFRRRSGRQQQLMRSVAVSTAHEQTAAATSRDWVVASEDHETVVMALGELSPDDREILLLKYTEDWTYRQLANHLGLKVKTIEHRLMKARRALRRRLHERGFEAD